MLFGPKRDRTPWPPGTRRPLIDLPRLPASKAAWRASLRSPRTWKRAAAVLGVLLVLRLVLGALFAAPAVPPLDQPGTEYSRDGVSIQLPANWMLVADSADLATPAIFFAPQPDPDAPPVSLSLQTIEVTEAYRAIVGDDQFWTEGRTQTSSEVLSTLLEQWAAAAGRPLPELTPVSYNADGTSTLSTGLLLSWPQGLAWTPDYAPIDPEPLPSTTPSLEPSASASAEAAPSSVPSAAPTPAPTPPAEYAQTGLHVTQFYAIPATASFRTETTRHVLVVTLVVPDGVEARVASEARSALDQVIASLITS